MNATPAQAVLAIRDLVIEFDADGSVGSSTTVVDHVNLELGFGEILALVGESGSGKSLTARALLGLLPDGAQARGLIQLGGKQVLGADEATLNQLRGTRAAMVFQEPQTALNPVQKVGWQIAQALRAHGKISRADARVRAIDLLRMVEIPEPERRVDWYPHQLSGGQKQRVVIALALSGSPDLLIADEPTTALDVTVQAEILQLLRNLRDRSGTAILLITHNMGVVADIADRVLVMRSGRVVEQQSVFDLFATPRESYTKALLAAVPRLPEADQPKPVVALIDSEGDALVPPILRFDAASIVYPARLGNREFRAVDQVSLTVQAGEVVGLVGESGSGKTTLGRAALGVIRASSGIVAFDGTDLGKISAANLRGLRKGMALIHQDLRHLSIRVGRSDKASASHSKSIALPPEHCCETGWGSYSNQFAYRSLLLTGHQENFPVVNASVLRWPEHLPSDRDCWWPMSRPALWMFPSKPMFFHSLPISGRNTTSHVCSSATILQSSIR